MRIIVTKNNKKRIISDKSLNGNELEAVYPETIIEDAEVLYRLTEAYKEEGSLTEEQALRLIEESFEY